MAHEQDIGVRFAQAVTDRDDLDGLSAVLYVRDPSGALFGPFTAEEADPDDDLEDADAIGFACTVTDDDVFAFGPGDYWGQFEVTGGPTSHSALPKFKVPVASRLSEGG